MQTKKQDKSFVVQAAILAAAGIIVRVIGLVYSIPLTAIIGDLGNGYYSSAYNIYSIILLICSYSIPMAISKLISAKNALGEYRTAHRVLQCAFCYVIVVGGIASILTYVLAPQIVDVEGAVLALQILAPTIFFSGILSVCRGFFQSQNTMVPTAISQLMEQVINACVSVGAAWMLSRPYVGAADGTLLPMYGAAGGAVGTGAGVVASLIFMLVLYKRNRRNYVKKLERDENPRTASYGEVIKMILLIVTPVILSTCIYNISTVVDMKVYYGSMEWKGIEGSEAASLYGIFSRKYMVLINVPVALASAMSSAVVPGISAAYEQGKRQSANAKITEALRVTMLVSIPTAVGMSILAKPIMDLLFPGSLPIASNLLRVGGISIVFYGISTVTNGALQGIGMVTIPMKNAAAALLIHLGLLIPLLYLTDSGLYAILAATVLYSLVVCILNQRALRKILNFKQRYGNLYLLPAVSAVIMGVFTWIGYEGTTRLLKPVFTSAGIRNLAGICVSVILSVVVYFICIVKLGGYTEEMLRKMPGGRLLAKTAKLLRLC